MPTTLTLPCRIINSSHVLDVARDEHPDGPERQDIMKAVTDSSFETDVLKADGPVLVDFWAEWCGPCKQIAPFLDELSKDMEGKLTVAKVNVDENPGAPGKYGVRGIPTMILFKGGQVAATKIGALPKSKLYEWVESVI